MSQFPAIGGKDLVRALKALGFEVRRTRGSHVWLEHPDHRSTVVPIHANETIGKGLFARILRECDVSRDDILKVL